MTIVNRWILRISVLLGVAVAVRVFTMPLFGFDPQRTVQSDVFQGIVAGAALGYITAQVFARFKTRKTNGWTTIFGCGMPGNCMLSRAACALVFPGPINVPEEAMYWTTSKDGGGRRLDGRNSYRMHFPPGGLPPNAAFWSLTMGDAQNRFVPNAINRYSVSDRSGLAPDADGAVEIYIQHTVPTGYESNWLPAPSSAFILWLRVYVPGEAILEGTYQVPPVVAVG